MFVYSVEYFNRYLVAQPIIPISEVAKQNLIEHHYLLADNQITW